MSRENLLKRFDQLAQQFHEIAQEEKGKLHAKVNDNDIIYLNVGGQKLTTKRSTLCQVEKSRLADMFRGRGEDSLERDQDGKYIFRLQPAKFHFHFGLPSSEEDYHIRHINTLAGSG